VLLLDPVNELFLGDPLAIGTYHHRRAVGIVGTYVDAAMPAELLKSHPDIGLKVFDQMADVDVPIGVWQGTGNENPSHKGAYSAEACGVGRVKSIGARFPGSTRTPHCN